MRKMLKGTYKTREPRASKKSRRSASELFEERATEKLGGSIAFVITSKLLWDSGDEKAE